MADRCQSCGRELGDIVHTTFQGNTVVVTYEVVEDDGSVTQHEHVCTD